MELPQAQEAHKSSTPTKGGCQSNSQEYNLGNWRKLQHALLRGKMRDDFLPMAQKAQKTGHGVDWGEIEKKLLDALKKKLRIPRNQLKTRANNTTATRPFVVAFAFLPHPEHPTWVGTQLICK